MTRRKTSMDWNLFQKAVDEYLTMGGKHLSLGTTVGDPLLDKRLTDRIRFVRGHPDFQILGIITTLQWLHLFDLDDIFECGLTWVSVSTTLTGPETYKNFFGVDLYERMLQNLKNLLTENRRRGHPLNVIISLKPTQERPEEIRNHPDYQAIKILYNQDLDIQSEQSMVVDDWSGSVTLPAYLVKRPLIPRMFRPCLTLYKTMIVFSNGNVGACACRDYNADSELILGNLH
ncbi:MAG: hypothetical protein H7833_09315 [Magnetococcus sp. DMHC-1]